MAINDKIQSITNFFNKVFTSKKENYYSPPKKKITVTAKNILIDFVEKYKGIRRTLLAIILGVNIYILFVTVEMYRKVNSVDVQWVIYAGYWTAILGTFIGFYTSSRIKKFNSDTPYSKKGEWLSSQKLNEPKIGATEFTPDELSSYSDQNADNYDLKL